MGLEKDVEKRLKDLIINRADFKVIYDDIKEETDIIDDLGFDSIKLMRLVVEIENEFKFKFKDMDLRFEIIGKFNKLCRYIVDSDKIGGLQDAR